MSDQSNYKTGRGTQINPHNRFQAEKKRRRF